MTSEIEPQDNLERAVSAAFQWTIPSWLRWIGRGFFLAAGLAIAKLTLSQLLIWSGWSWMHLMTTGVPIEAAILAKESDKLTPAQKRERADFLKQLSK